MMKKKEIENLLTIHLGIEKSLVAERRKLMRDSSIDFSKKEKVIDELVHNEEANELVIKVLKQILA